MRKTCFLVLMLAVLLMGTTAVAAQEVETWRCVDNANNPVSVFSTMSLDSTLSYCSGRLVDGQTRIMLWPVPTNVLLVRRNGENIVVSTSLGLSSITLNSNTVSAMWNHGYDSPTAVKWTLTQ
jgi:hypothetical protein